MPPLRPLRVAVLAEEGDLAAARVARLTGARLLPLAPHGPLALRGYDLVHLFVPAASLVERLDGLRLALPRVVAATPVGEPEPAALDRRVHRYVFPTQAEALAWARAGATLGRVMVVGPGEHEAEAWAVVWRESAVMARRAGLGELVRGLRRGR